MDFSQKINRNELRKVFQKSFNPEVWKTILIQVFGANKVYAEPKSYELNNGDNAKVQGYQLGEIITPDKYTIGLFQFEIKSGHNIPMNRVGLRGLVEKEIKYFYDAALVVYYNDTQWRLSYICDMEDGKTAPKRFTYVFGDKDQTYRTPIDRFEFIKLKGAYKNIIHEAFSVEALNKDFYKFIAKQFYKLVGATTGKGKNKEEHTRIMKLPGDPDNLTYQEFAVRLIGRTVFCWFLKEKKSREGVPLLPGKLLSSNALKSYGNYYHTIIERIFFKTLNTPMMERVENLPDGCELIPFLNGGLFDYHDEDFYSPGTDGISTFRDELVITDEWFADLFGELEQYNFTIDENSPDDIEVSVDPEMLGRIFENLLAEIDPDSGETARKATGSFYTPREIVDYMATESLVYYLNRKTAIDIENLYPLFRPSETVPDFKDSEKVELLKALDEVKILDPACGSGAFPMGVLMKIINALQILDKDAKWWKKRQIEKIENAKVRQEMQEKLDTATVEYARKIGIIQNTLYGVDIQPIAAEISKLRCFLTLIVDETVNDNKANRGVEPLPNLEFKFVTADSLMKLPQTDLGGLFGRDNIYELAEKLKQLRIDYMQSYGKRKHQIRDQFLATQRQISAMDKPDSLIDVNSREYLIGTWNPFNNDKSDWFDPEWMFGVKDGFDVVIGNPPYVEAKKLKGISNKLKPDYKVYSGTADLSCYFTERGINLAKNGGILLFITTNKFFTTGYGEKVRSYLLRSNIYEIIDFEQVEVFENTLVSSVVLGIVNETAQKDNIIKYEKFHKLNRKDFLEKFNLKKGLFNEYPQYKLDNSEWSFSDEAHSEIKKKIEFGCSTLSSIQGISIFRGVTTGYNPAFIIDEDLKESLISSDFRNSEIIKPLLQGRHIRKWVYNYCGEYFIFAKQGILIDDYPFVKTHLMQYYSLLIPRADGDTDQVKATKEGRKPGSYKWFEIQDNTAYYPEFEKPEKIIWGLTADKWSFAYDDKQHYLPSNGYILTSELIPIKYILGILNSNLMKYYFGFIGVMTAGGAYTLKHSTIQRLPLRIADNMQPFIDIVDNILNAKSINTQADISNFEAEIDRMVYDLYGLSPEEINVIENS